MIVPSATASLRLVQASLRSPQAWPPSACGAAAPFLLAAGGELGRASAGGRGRRGAAGGDLAVPRNISLVFLPPQAPELDVTGWLRTGLIERISQDHCRFGSVTDFTIEATRGVGFNGSTIDSVGYGIALASSGCDAEGVRRKPRHIWISNGQTVDVFASGINVSEPVGIQITDIQVTHRGYRRGQRHLRGYAAVSVKNDARNVVVSNVYGDGTSIGFLVINAHDVTCESCLFANTAEQGVLVRSQVGTGLRPRRVVVRGVRVVEPGTVRSPEQSVGFAVVGADDTRLIDSEAVSEGGAMEYGFHIDAGSRGTRLSGCCAVGPSIAAFRRLDRSDAPSDEPDRCEGRPEALMSGATLA